MCTMCLIHGSGRKTILPDYLMSAWSKASENSHLQPVFVKGDILGK